MSPPARVLVVDDYAPSRYGFRRILTLGGYDVAEAPDGQTALRLLETGDFVAMVLDVNLPDANGVELCRRIKQQRPKLVVVLISASYQASTNADEWQAAGASAFLEQPIHAGELVATLGRLLA